eukprot:3610367-Amphidinium_carterae.1
MPDRLECGRCRARSAMQYKTKFVIRHSNSAGINAMATDDALASSSREHARHKSATGIHGTYTRVPATECMLRKLCSQVRVCLCEKQDLTLLQCSCSFLPMRWPCDPALAGQCLPHHLR